MSCRTLKLSRELHWKSFWCHDLFTLQNDGGKVSPFERISWLTYKWRTRHSTTMALLVTMAFVETRFWLWLRLFYLPSSWLPLNFFETTQLCMTTATCADVDTPGIQVMNAILANMWPSLGKGILENMRANPVLVDPLSPRTSSRHPTISTSYQSYCTTLCRNINWSTQVWMFCRV